MRGLLLKEFYTVRRCLWEFPALAALLFLQALLMGPGRLSFGASMLLVYTFRVFCGQQESDDRCGWKNHTLALPVRRSAIVGARHLVYLALLICVAALAFGLEMLTGLATGAGINLHRTLLTTGYGLVIPLVVSAVFGPVLYGFGTRARARFTAILMCLVPLILIALFLDLPALFTGIFPSVDTLPVLAGCLGALLLANAASAALSVRIYHETDPPKDYSPPKEGPATL
ncbi:ABC-2 transporter permease [Ruminococcaceae bacterium OttesenSCG-928-D13]|nr:ABC-2 transporter permease [Ruminococcaceae bacterium OttesenSCG-928-D13]